jgi:hypothetical protein
MHPDEIRDAFVLYNRLAFGDQLPMLSIELDDLTDTEVVGCWDPDSMTIWLGIELEPYDLHRILLHEMIHAEEWFKHGTSGHGAFFRKRRKEIKGLLGFDPS